VWWFQSSWVFVLLLFGVNGCATLRSPTVPSAQQRATLPSAQELLQTLETRRQTLTSLRGLARVIYKDTQEKGTAKQAVAVAAPDRFRWELFSPVGVAALVASNGNQLSTYFPSEKVLYRGAATAENVARFTRVSLSPREIVGLLLGAPVLPATTDSCSIQLDTEKEWHRLTCPAAGQAGVQLWFEPQTLRLRRVEIQAADGTTTRRMDLADYRTVGEYAFPFEIVLSDLQGQQQASIFYERVELNPHPPDSIFTLASLNGVREVDADAFSP